MNNPQPWWLSWPVAEVAAAILPYFSSRPHVTEVLAIRDIVTWWTTVKPEAVVSTSQFENPDSRAAAEAIQALEHAGLLMRSVNQYSNFIIGLTRLGSHALQTDTVRQHLGLGDTSPTV
jgi:hypothetical protein